MSLIAPLKSRGKKIPKCYLGQFFLAVETICKPLYRHDNLGFEIALIVRSRNHALGRLRDPPGRYYGRSARCSLHDRRRQCRRRKRGPGDRKPAGWSAERRAGQRHWPVIPGDPGIGPTARRAKGCGVPRPAPVGALPPLVSARGPKGPPRKRGTGK